MSDAIIIGSDHAGFAAKEQVKAYLEAKGLEVVDAGCYSEESVPYPIYAKGRGPSHQPRRVSARYFDLRHGHRREHRSQ